MSDSTAKKLTRLILLTMAIQLFLVGFVMWEGYQGRSHLVDAQRASCARGKLDRIANSHGWRIAEKARRQAGEIVIANDYARLASGLESRSRIPCMKAFPKASLIP